MPLNCFCERQAEVYLQRESMGERGSCRAWLWFGRSLSLPVQTILPLAALCIAFITCIDGFLFADDAEVINDGPRPVPKPSLERKEYAAELLRPFATRAYRRPVDDAAVDRLVSLAESVYGSGKETFESGVAQAMTATLASPRFLFREEG